MIIALRTQFHVERPWVQHPFSVLNVKAVVAAFNQEKALSRGLLRDYEPSDGPFWSTILNPNTIDPILGSAAAAQSYKHHNTSHHLTTTGHAAQQLEASVKQFFVHTFNCSQHGSIEFYETEKILSFSHWQHLLHDLHLVLLKLFVIQPASIFRHLGALHSY